MATAMAPPRFRKVPRVHHPKLIGSSVLLPWYYRASLRTSSPPPISRMPAPSTQRATPPPVLGSRPVIPLVTPLGDPLLAVSLPEPPLPEPPLPPELSL